MPWVTGRAYAPADRRLELLDPQDEATEEHRREQRQQRQLDGLPLEDRDHGYQQSQPERGREQQRDHEREQAGRPEQRDTQNETRSQTDRAAIPPPRIPNAATLPITISLARIGEVGSDRASRSGAPGRWTGR